jgi:hypothetical protein
MCYTCGCKLPFEDHGDPGNLIEDRFIDAGKTKEIKNAGRVKAKQNMLELLQEEQVRGELAKPRKTYDREETPSKS